MGTRPIGTEVDIVVKGESCVDPVGLIRSLAHRGYGPPGEDRADPAATQHVALHANHREVRGLHSERAEVVGPSVQPPDAKPSDLARHAKAALDRYRMSILQPDPTAKE